MKFYTKIALGTLLITGSVLANTAKKHQDLKSLREAYDSSIHAFQNTDAGWQAKNLEQQWTAHFDGQSFVTSPLGQSWTWGLQLQSYGFAGSEVNVTGTATIQTDGQRLTYQWSSSLQEWFINDRRGLEHGFIISEPPQKNGRSSKLQFTMKTVGNLKAVIASDSLGVHFYDENNSRKIDYSGLKVWDADGKMLHSSFEGISENTIRLSVDEANARYPITIDPVAQQAYLKASNSGSEDKFGTSVSISGNYAIVGAPQEDSSSRIVNGPSDELRSGSGAAYIFVRNGASWSQQAILKADNADINDIFGSSVAIEGDTVVVGAPQEGSGSAGVNGDGTNNNIGSSGAAYVFTRVGSTWSQQAYLKASNPGRADLFGLTVAISGNTIVVGAADEDSNTTAINGDGTNDSATASGAAYVFSRTVGTWTQEAYLKASNAETSDNFGCSVAIWNNVIVVGARFEDGSGLNTSGDPADDEALSSGAAYVFRRNNRTWTQEAYLKASNTEAQDQFGYAVAVSGDLIAVTAIGDDSNATGVGGSGANNLALESGAAYVFVYNGGSWAPLDYLKASNRTFGFGSAVALSNGILLVSSSAERGAATGVGGDQSDAGLTSAGAVYSFTCNDAFCTQGSYLKASNTGFGDQFGTSVAVSGTTGIVGAPFEDSGSRTINDTLANQNDNSEDNTGASYVFSNFDKPIGARAAEISIASNSNPVVVFYNRPGKSLKIQRSTNLLNWTQVAASTVAADGRLSFTDASPPPGKAFYRAVLSP